MLFELCLIFVVTTVLACLCLHHHRTQRKLIDTSYHDEQIVREAAELSITASNTINPILALVAATRAVQLLESLHVRYGPDLASELTFVDTHDMLAVLQDQKDRILQDVMVQVPRFVPPHPLIQHARYLPPAPLPTTTDDEAAPQVTDTDESDHEASSLAREHVSRSDPQSLRQKKVIHY